MTPFELEQTLSTMTMIVDSREHPTKEAKKRWDAFGVPYVIEGLKSGDYTARFTFPDGSIYDMRDVAICERKMSLTEICGNFGQNRQRFIREFERIKKVNAKVYLIVENASWENAYAGRYRSKMHPNALVANLVAWMARYDTHIIFCKAETAPKLIKEILYREAKERFQKL